MAKQLNVNMAFTANTSQAKREVQNLQNTLNNLMGHKFDINIDADKIHNAITATAELSAHLQKATNIDTGNLDFSKLSQSLKSSGKTLMDYGKSLQQLGPEGQKAFMQLTAAVAQAEVPIRRTHALVKEFATTLANTARWQISSSVLHGFMGALQSAYGYAQDLNESLNNIRIVTGQSVDDMAKFAKEANKAAKALSATTTEYTNASLIYYQQGLSDAEVKKRADVTVKLANVSRQSAETVSEQMTAVWNNFYDGSKSLEYYADVMTALGAATASSTEEIAGGLEKFAAVADTIGLSYEYAASALATITSNTRQSEEVVGTALKTLFARIQGLNLGETLDDGTTLNKYSQAMAKVGINILDASGNLKDMDNILNEMGNKWDNISKAQQVALAQTVAGTRQYNQLIALMDNWNSGDGDSFMANLATATGSSGALQEQADIYAESWEAAADRVQAAAEAIYDKLINDEFFIDLLNNVEKIISFVDKLIDNLGGLKGVLVTIGTIVTKLFSQQLSKGLTDTSYNLQMMTKSGRKKVQSEREDFIKNASTDLAKSAGGSSKNVQNTAKNFYDQQLACQQLMLEKQEKMNELEKVTVQNLMEQLRIRGDLAIKTAEQQDAAQREEDALASSLYGSAKVDKGAQFDAKKTLDSLDALKQVAVAGAKVDQILLDIGDSSAITEDQIEQLKNELQQIKNIAPITDEDIIQIEKIAKSTNIKDAKTQIGGLMRSIEEASRDAAGSFGEATLKDLEKYQNAVKKTTKTQLELANAEKQIEETTKNVTKTIKEAHGARQTWADTLVATTNAALGVASAFEMIASAWDVIADPNLSGWEKFKTLLTTMTMLIPTVLMVINSLGQAIHKEEGETWKAALSKIFKAKATREAAKAAKEEETAIKNNTNAQKEESATDVVDTVINKPKKSKKSAPPVFKGKSGKDRQFAGYNRKTGQPIDQYGDIIGKEFYSQAGLNEKGKRIKPKKAPKGDGVLKKAFPKGGGPGASVGAMAGALAALAVVVIAAAVAIQALDKAYNKNEQAAQRAEKASKELSKAYDNTRNKYEELNNTISSYNDAKDGIKELTRGTAEFTMQIQKANDEALKLIENYAGSEGFSYSVNADGLITIDEASLEKIKTEEAKKVTEAQSAAIIAKQQAREARETADITALNRQKIKSDEGFTSEDANRTGTIAAGAGAAGAATGLAIGAALGSAIPVAGTLIGAVAGLTIGAIGGAIGNAVTKHSETTEENDAIKALSEAYQEKGDAALTDESIKDIAKGNESLAQELIKNREEIRILCQEMAANTAATRAESQAMAASILSTDDTVQSSVHKDYIATFAGDAYQEETEKAYNKYMSTTMTDWLGIGTEEGKAQWAEYAKAAGIDSKNGYKVTNYKKDGSVEYEYLDEEGKKQKAIVTKEQVAATLAASDAEEATKTAGKNIANILSNVDTNTVQALAGAKNKNMSQMTMGQLTKKTDLSKLNKDDLTALGFTGDVDDVAALIAAQKQQSIADIKSYAADYGSTVSTAMSNIIKDNGKAIEYVTQGTLKEYSSTIDELNTAGGSEAVDKFNSMITSLMSANELQSDAIMQAANNIDWSQGEVAMQDFNYQLLQMGINIDENSNEWTSLVGSLQEANVSVLNNDLDSVRKKLTEIKELTKDIEIGSIVSDEDYNNLIKYNAALAEQFVMTANGYMYVGKKDEDGKFINDIDSVGETTQRQLENIKKTNTNAKNAVKAKNSDRYKSVNWESLAEGIATETDIKTVTKLLAEDKENAIGAALGISSDKLKDLQAALNSDDPEAKKKAREKLQQMFSDIQTMQYNEDRGIYEDSNAEEVVASQMSVAQLDAAKKSGAISSDTADIFKNVLSEATNADKDIFRDINKELEDVEFNLSKIEKAKENAFGPDKIDLIKQETEQLQQQIEAEKERQDLLNTKINNQKTQLTEDYSFLTFNADGSISNYDDLYTNLTEDEWEAAKKAIDDYEQSLAEARESELTILDLQSEANSKNLEAYEAADEALSKYTEKLQHHNNVLEHYKNLSALIGKENDYKSMGEILKGQASILSNSYKASEKNYQMYQDEVTNWENLMNDTKRALTSAKEAGNEDKATRLETLLDTYTKNWEDAQAKSREAQDAMLSDLQTWAESEKAILDNTLADLGHTLETTLTGGQTFDELSTQMERAQSLQEDYLTTTNQIYETTKMMRTAQQAIDASSNAVAKEKLKGFINETKSMQEQGKLSQYELDMQQAKYDLLVAEIALEEAQNAKSTVRLQRDAEGNFGYVYTADTSAVADAQQKFDDAQNALYNKGLEGANNYTQKYQQTMAEMQDSLTQIQSDYLAGSFASEEEYQNAVAESKAYYFEKLRGYADLYNTALSADSSIAAEAWSTNFSMMFQSTEELESAVSSYMTGAEAAFEHWSEVVATVEETTGADLDSLTTKIGNVTSASDALTQALLGENGEGGLISEIKSGFEEVAKSIKTALESWAGVTITMNEDGTVTVTENPTNAEGAATGGLTSNWGPEGKMLMVHENELILNADQTNKFFDNLALMESILATIDTYALGQQLGGSLISPDYASSSTNTLEQSVHIEASFPGVTDRNEIEEAFNNLVNKASQYANRK